VNFSNILMNLAEAISKADEDSSNFSEATNVLRSREPFLRVPFQFLERPDDAAIGLWLIDETDNDHTHQATLWQIVPFQASVTEQKTSPGGKPAVAIVDSSAFKKDFSLRDQDAIRKAFPIGLSDFKETSARRLFASALGGIVDFNLCHDVLLPLRAKKGEDLIGVLQLITPNGDPADELEPYFAQLTAVTDIIAASIEAGRRRRMIDAIDRCQKTLLQSRSSASLAAALSKELLIPCSALSCAVYRPGRDDTLIRIAQSSDGAYDSPEMIERDSFTYWVYERAVNDPGASDLTHFANLAATRHIPEAPPLKRNIDLPDSLSADRTSWLSFTVQRQAAEGFDGNVPILFLRLLTAPHKGFLGGSFSTTARDIVEKLGRHVSEVFSNLFQLEALAQIAKKAPEIRAKFPGFVTWPDFLRLECEFGKLVKDLLFCVKDVYVAQRVTAAGTHTTLRDCHAQPVTSMPLFSWTSRKMQPGHSKQLLDYQPYNGCEGVDVTVNSVDNFNFGLRCVLGRRPFARYEWRVLEQIVAELRFAEMGTLDLAEKLRQTAEIRHALRAEMNGVLGHLYVANEIYEMCLANHRSGDDTIALRDLLDSARFRKSMKRALLSSEGLGAVLENSSIRMSEMRSVKLQRSRVDISHMLKDIRIPYMPELERRKINIIDKSLSGVLASCDGRLIKMALFNLFDNAVKYAFQKHPITVKAVDHSSYISVAITNIGPHIKPEDVDMIFEPFHRITFKGVQPMPGTGLGLPVARKIAEVHGGQITVKSNPFHASDVTQAETTFTFLIPKGSK
jgi:signal transduction histidine kinase